MSDLVNTTISVNGGDPIPFEEARRDPSLIAGQMMASLPFMSYPVPMGFTDDTGRTVDYIDASDIQHMAQAMIDGQDRFSHLRPAKILYLWKREGGSRNGKAIGGECVKPGGLTKYFSHAADFVIWIAADNNFRTARRDIEAIVFHELLHAGLDPDTGKYTIWPHDFEGFRAEIEEYGLWSGSAKQIAPAFHQASMDL